MTTSLFHEQTAPGFAPGIRIATDRGARPVAALRPGDRVLTRDSGYRPVLWAGALAAGGMAVRAAIPATGRSEGGPLVSTSQRLLLAGADIARLSGDREVLAAAGDLARGHATARPEPFRQILLAAHEVILADGVWCGSLYLQPTAPDWIPRGLHRTLIGLASGSHDATARRCLPPQDAALIRHASRLDPAA